MSSVAKKEHTLIDGGKSFRSSIDELEKNILSMEGAESGDASFCPLKHTFSDGIYVREIFIPAGTMLTGKIHKHQHPNFLMSGEVVVVTEEGGEEHLVGPMSIMSPPGTKRALHALTDLVWITVHHNPENYQDLESLENVVIADTFEDYELFLESEKSKKIEKPKSLIRKLINFVGGL